MMKRNEKMRLALGAALLAALLFAVMAAAGPGVRQGLHGAAAAGAGGAAMTDLLRAVAGLSQSHGGLSVGRFGDPGRGGFWLARSDGGPEVAVVTAANAARFGEVAGDQAEGYARLLSGASAMLDLLATALLRWEGQVGADTEIDGGDAVEWLSEFATEARRVLETMVGPLAPGKVP